jgi:hypothetical protein
MHILSSQLQLSNQHDEQRQSWLTTELNLHTRPNFAQQLAQIKADLAGRPPARPERGSETPAAALEAKRRQFQSLLELLFGDRSPISSCPSATPMSGQPNADAPPVAVVNLQITTRIHVTETESCQMSASGNVCLADGSLRQFATGFSLARATSFDYLSQTASVLHDPLVLDLGSPSMALAPKAVSFDLDTDGKAELLHLPQAEMLFLDRNGNGKVDNGHELFGAKTGDGFAELAQLDSDRNGWVDGGDAAFAELKLWRGELNQIRALRDAGVGALSVNSIATPMSEKSADVVLAKMRASGVWLGESAGAGFIRQIDLNTKA